MAIFEGNHQEAAHDYGELLMGNNQFETGVLALSAGERAESGTVLELDAESGSYKVAAADNPLHLDAGALAVLVDNRAFEGAGSFAVRVCIAGKVARPLVRFGGNAPTDAQAAALRNYGILALPVAKVQ